MTLTVEQMKANREEFEAKERMKDREALRRAILGVEEAIHRLESRCMNESLVLAPALDELKSAYRARLEGR